MPVLRITKHGERVLKTPCPVLDYEAFKPELPVLLKDMWATMAAARGVGLAAPQIGLSLRIAVIDVKPEGKSSRIVLINPEILSLEGELNDEEGCLSLPGVYHKLRRHARARVRALDEHGVLRELAGEGLLARAFQHEIDHLDGKLYVDRLEFEDRLKVLDVIKTAKPAWD
ncbi:MAG: peptide deformylase [Elusimicrobia bacterium CG11_big_fil_rev_8_21_14_0_20_64_6]|nr:MAG: peptide deformylase [Elusimicrobia bacterium CG11_big_fil_rev_8_21_14_0_20_64_6]